MNRALLLIDDKEDFKESFQTLAQRKGYKLAWGKSFEDLESRLPPIRNKITAVILDIKCLMTNDQAIENEDFIGRAILFLEAEYDDLPRLILTGDEEAFSLSRFFKEEKIFRKDPEDIEKLFKEIEKYSLAHEHRIKTNDEKEFYKILEGIEGKKLEFKTSVQYSTKANSKDKSLHFEIIKTLAAFANSEGGVLMIGIDDDKKIFGLEDGDYKTISSINKQDAFKLLFDDLIENNFGNAFQTILEEIKFYLIEDKTICKIEVKSRHSHPVFVEKKQNGKQAYQAFLIRGQASTRELKESEKQNYIEKNWK